MGVLLVEPNDTLRNDEMFCCCCTTSNDVDLLRERSIAPPLPLTVRFRLDVFFRSGAGIVALNDDMMIFVGI